MSTVYQLPIGLETQIMLSIDQDPSFSGLGWATTDFLESLIIAKQQDTPTLIYFNGVEGSGKTKFLSKYLLQYLMAHNIIQNRLIKKIYYGNINSNDDLINFLEDNKDGIIILSGLTHIEKKGVDVETIINETLHRSDFNKTLFILSGTEIYNQFICEKYGWAKNYNIQFNFPAPDKVRLTNMFKDYLFEKTGQDLTDCAVKELQYYFILLKSIKQQRFIISKSGIKNYNYQARTFMYASEMPSLLNEIKRSDNSSQLLLTGEDITNLDIYQKLISL